MGTPRGLEGWRFHGLLFELHLLFMIANMDGIDVSRLILNKVARKVDQTIDNEPAN